MAELIVVLFTLLSAILGSVTASTPATRAPHHDDELTVAFPFGEFHVVRGDQSTLDAGRVVFWGEPCAHLHLAGHRTTHGAVFHEVPTLVVGDHVTVWSASVACTYAVTETRTQLGNLEPQFDDLMVQTSWPGGFWLAFGARV